MLNKETLGFILEKNPYNYSEDIIESIKDYKDDDSNKLELDNFTEEELYDVCDSIKTMPWEVQKKCIQIITS